MPSSHLNYDPYARMTLPRYKLSPKSYKATKKNLLCPFEEVWSIKKKSVPKASVKKATKFTWKKKTNNQNKRDNNRRAFSDKKPAATKGKKESSTWTELSYDSDRTGFLSFSSSSSFSFSLEVKAAKKKNRVDEAPQGPAENKSQKKASSSSSSKAPTSRRSLLPQLSVSSKNFEYAKADDAMKEEHRRRCNFSVNFSCRR